MPVESANARRQLRQLLDLQLKNRRNAWEMQGDGSYFQRAAKGREGAVCSHRRLIERAERRLATRDRAQRNKKKE